MRVHPGMPRRVGRVLGDRLHRWRGHAAIVGQFGDVAEAPTKKCGAHLRSLTTALGAKRRRMLRDEWQIAAQTSPQRVDGVGAAESAPRGSCGRN
jgi:hypothetical protein